MTVWLAVEHKQHGHLAKKNEAEESSSWQLGGGALSGQAHDSIRAQWSIRDSEVAQTLLSYQRKQIGGEREGREGGRVADKTSRDHDRC